MSEEEARKLNELQSAYEYEPYSPRKAYEYFHELNKNQFYVNVVKEHDEF